MEAYDKGFKLPQSCQQLVDAQEIVQLKTCGQGLNHN
jgi:hypothetical protein